MEGFRVISGSIESHTDLKYITEVASKRYIEYTTAHHEWINNIEPSKYRLSLDAVRTDRSIIDKISEEFPNSAIVSVSEADEIYWAVSPKGAVGSDRSLVDCHYDSPLGFFPTGGVIFYRIIIACNENTKVTTVFPDEDKRVMMNTKDFHGLDYNKDIHCVEGTIPKDKVRVLLKLHYLIIPKGSEGYQTWVRSINVWWTILSRETMRMSANPKAWYEYLVAFIVNISRITFNNFYSVALCILVLFCIRHRLFLLKRIRKILA